jgi:hypothetical protein
MNSLVLGISPVPSRAPSLSDKEFSLGFLDDFFALHPDLDSVCNDIDSLPRIPDLFTIDVPENIPNGTPNDGRFAIHVCKSALGSPPKLGIHAVILPGCIGDCDATARETLDLSRDIRAAVVAIHRKIEHVPVPTKEASPFLVGAVLLGIRGVTSMYVDVSPHPGGKTYFGTKAQRHAIFEAMGSTTWYIATFESYDVVFIVPDTYLKPTLIRMIGLKCTDDTITTAAVFFEVDSGRKQIPLAMGKYVFLFYKISIS